MALRDGWRGNNVPRNFQKVSFSSRSSYLPLLPPWLHPTPQPMFLWSPWHPYHQVQNNGGWGFYCSCPWLHPQCWMHLQLQISEPTSSEVLSVVNKPYIFAIAGALAHKWNIRLSTQCQCWGLHTCVCTAMTALWNGQLHFHYSSLLPLHLYIKVADPYVVLWHLCVKTGLETCRQYVMLWVFILEVLNLYQRNWSRKTHSVIVQLC